MIAENLCHINTRELYEFYSHLQENAMLEDPNQNRNCTAKDRHDDTSRTHCMQMQSKSNKHPFYYVVTRKSRPCEDHLSFTPQLVDV